MSANTAAEPEHRDLMPTSLGPCPHPRRVPHTYPTRLRAWPGPIGGACRSWGPRRPRRCRGSAERASRDPHHPRRDDGCDYRAPVARVNAGYRAVEDRPSCGARGAEPGGIYRACDDLSTGSLPPHWLDRTNRCAALSTPRDQRRSANLFATDSPRAWRSGLAGARRRHGAFASGPRHLPAHRGHCYDIGR
jgi:hypothetical protein